jgi:hypothetical protein
MVRGCPQLRRRKLQGANDEGAAAHCCWTEVVQEGVFCMPSHAADDDGDGGPWVVRAGH